MRRSIIVATAITAAAFALAGCSSPASTSGAPSTSVVASPSESTTPNSVAVKSRTGEFAGANEKSVAGTVTVADGKIVVSGFSSDEGPDLHIYLTNGTDESAVSAGKEIGTISFNMSSQTFALNGADASMYTTVVIHCDKAKAVFGAATLS